MDRFPTLTPWMDNLSPELQPQIARPLYQALTLVEKLDHVTLPSRLREQLPSLLNLSLPKILQAEGKSLLENVEAARGLLRAVVSLGREYGRFTTWAEGSPPTLSDYDKRQSAFVRCHDAYATIEPHIDSLYRNSIMTEIIQAQAAVLNRFTAPTQAVIEAAFSGKRMSQKRLQTAGNVLHQATALNERILNSYELNTEKVKAIKGAAIDQHLTLIENDLLGYHGDSALVTARATVWHGRRIFEKIYPSPDQTKRVVAYLEDLANHFHAQVVVATPADKADFPPSRMHLLVSLRELDKLIFEKLTELGDATAVKPIAERLRQTHETMGMIEVRTQAYGEAIDHFQRAVEVSLDQGTIADTALFSLLEAYEKRDQLVPEAERAYVWRLNIEKRLVPLFTLFNANRDSPLLAAEIAVLNSNLRDGSLTEGQTQTLAAAIIWVVEEPSILSLRLLKKVSEDIVGEQSGPTLKRLQDIAGFFDRGWQEQGQYINEVTALMPYRRFNRAESQMALAAVATHLEDLGRLSPEAAVVTLQAAVRVMVADLQGEQGEDFFKLLSPDRLPPAKAAPIIQRNGASQPIGEVRINLDEITARRWELTHQAALRDVLLAQSHPVSLDEDTSVQIAEAVALVPVDRSPQAEPTTFTLQLITQGAARTLVFREGQMVGGFITTADHPTINICQLVGTGNTSNLFEAQPVSGLSLEEREAHGDLVGMFEIVSLPIVVDQRRDGGGKDFSFVPSPPSGGALVVPTVDKSQLLTGAIPIESVISGMRIEVADIAEIIGEVRNGTAAVPQLITYEKTVPNPLITHTPYAGLDLKGTQGDQHLFFGMRGSSLVPSSPPLPAFTRSTPVVQFGQAAIGTSTRIGTPYGEFTDDFRTRVGVAPSVLRVSIVAVSPQNASMVVA